MNAFTNASFRSEDGEKELGGWQAAEWQTEEQARHSATVAEVAAMGDDEYVTPEQMAAHGYQAGCSMHGESDRFAKHLDGVKASIKEVNPDWWMGGLNLKKWVACSNGLLG